MWPRTHSNSSCTLKLFLLSWACKNTFNQLASQEHFAIICGFSVYGRIILQRRAASSSFLRHWTILLCVLWMFSLLYFTLSHLTSFTGHCFHVFSRFNFESQRFIFIIAPSLVFWTLSKMPQAALSLPSLSALSKPSLIWVPWAWLIRKIWAIN